MNTREQEFQDKFEDNQGYADGVWSTKRPFRKTVEEIVKSTRAVKVAELNERDFNRVVDAAMCWAYEGYTAQTIRNKITKLIKA